MLIPALKVPAFPDLPRDQAPPLHPLDGVLLVDWSLLVNAFAEVEDGDSSKLFVSFEFVCAILLKT